MNAMGSQPYDAWYDHNEIDETNRVQVLRTWASPDLEITCGKVVLLGDDEQDPVPARIVSFNEMTDVITLEVLFNEQHAAPYLAQDVAAQRLSGKMSVADVASKLRRRFSLSPIATMKVLRHAGVPLAEGKIAVDATLSAEALRQTDELRESAWQALLADERYEPL
jgi:hypothetical protein